MAIYISSSLVTSTTELEYPLTHARIGYQSIVTINNVSGTAGLSGYPITNLSNPATFEQYRPDGTTATINIDAGQSVTCDYVAMQQRNVTGVSIYYSTDDVTYTLLQDYNTGGINGADMALFDETSARYWRVVLTGDNMVISAFKVGKALAMQRAIYGGHTPILLNPSVVTRPNLSETGQFLGSSVKRKGFSTSFAWENLKASWYRDNFDLFVKSYPQANPFFIAWRPLTFQKEVAYCLATGNISPSNIGVKDFMSVSMNVEGFADVV